MKAKCQCVLNDGSWRVAWHLVGLPDSLAKKTFAGTAVELEAAVNWVRAVDELKTRTNPIAKPEVSEDDEEDGGGGKGAKGQWKKKKKKAEE